MDTEYIIKNINANAGVFKALFKDVSDEEAVWKPVPEKWSLLEIVNHLYDEEREDFRARVDSALHKKEYGMIDPQGWVSERKYCEREFRVSVNNFLEERRMSVQWLEKLEAPDWELPFEHPKIKMSAGEMLANWLAHDYRHIEQIVRTRHAYLGSITGDGRLRYAG